MKSLSSLFGAALLAACSSTAVPTPDMSVGCSSNAECATSTTGHVCSQSRACVVCATDRDCGPGHKCSNQTACVECLTGGDCAPGSKCVATACVPGCDEKNPCPSGKVCDGALNACVDCAADADCAASSAGRKCDATAHKCVGCLGDDDCGAGQVCHAQACAAGCSGVHPSCPTGQVCSITAGACVQCLADADCKSPNAPRCDTTASKCVACLPSNDNCAPGTYCAGTACVAGCRTDLDCAGSSSSGADGGTSSGGAQCNLPTHQCVQCVTDSACPSGQVCAGNQCVAGCTAQHSCPGGQGCCGGGCVNIYSDPANCGGCGNACATGQGCCGGVCISLSTVENCGGCGSACGDVVNGTRACSASTCGIGSCNGTYADCDKSAANGCEVNTATDGANCGACGRKCSPLPNAAPGCSGGNCVLGACNAGFADCDLAPQNGCEVDLTKDNANCGVCNNVCPPVANGTGGCTAGKCAIGSCNPGFADCDNNPKTGCETPTSSDVNNCGGCGVKCATGKFCAGGKCVAGCGGPFSNATTFTLDTQMSGVNFNFHPQGMTYDPTSGDLILALQGPQKLWQVSLTGQLVGTIPISVSGQNSFNYMTSIAADQNYFYLSDYTCNSSCPDFFRVAKSGGAPTNISSDIAAFGGYAVALLLDGTLFRGNITPSYDWSVEKQLRVSSTSNVDNIVRTINVPIPSGMGDVTSDGVTLWALGLCPDNSRNCPAALYHVNPTDGSILEQYTNVYTPPNPLYPAALAYAQGYLYVLNYSEVGGTPGTITRLACQ